jgi:hypothetical protein
MQCPKCGDEYESGITMCADCRIPLAPPGTRAPLRTSHLGRFAAPVGDRVLQALRAKGIDYDFERDDADGFVIRVDVDWRDDIASQLFTGWAELLGGLDRDVAFEMTALGGTHPGWHDAPHDAWTDRQGRLQVDIDDEGDPDTGRAVGPAMVVIGMSVLLLALVDAVAMGLGVTVGLGLLVLGALLPR